jgi:putative sigma-54 modulation protein
MHIRITPHHVALTSALQSFTMNKVGAASKRVGPDTAAHVVLRLDPKATRERRFIARIRFALRGTDMFVSGTDANLHAAINQMVGKIPGEPGKFPESKKMEDRRPERAPSHATR